jgi:membrane fusion protein
MSELYVSEGAIVTKGQRLAVVVSDQPSDGGQRYSHEGMDALDAQQVLARGQIGIAGDRLASERMRIEASLSGFSEQRDNIQRQLSLQREAVESAKNMFEQLSQLVERGFVSKLEVERRRQAYIVARQEESRLTQQLTSVETQRRQAVADMARIGVDRAASVSNAESSVQGLRQQRSRLKSEGSYLIEAPASGRVTALQTNIGRTVGGQIPLMSILPEKAALQADIFAPSKAIGFIVPGQEVKLLYDAFPYQRFGSFEGRVVSVSRVVLSPNELDVPLKIEEPVYRVTVSLKAQHLKAFGNQILLQPGMTLTANLVLDRQSFWDWLMNPLRAVRNRT